MQKPPSRILHTATITLAIVAAFLVGYQLRGTGHLTPVWAAQAGIDDTPSVKPLELFEDAFTKVQHDYVDKIKDPNELAYGAIRGMLATIHDPYTRFMDPKEYKDFEEQTEGQFAGIGATLNMNAIPNAATNTTGDTSKDIICPVCGTNLSKIQDFQVTIVKPLPGSPAEKAGLLAGDVIAKVDDFVTEGKTLDEVVGKIRGPEGTPVTLTITRKGVEKPLALTITRAIVDVPATEHKILDGNIGYLRLYSFNEKTVPESTQVLKSFNEAHVRGLVLDLRGDPGGLLTECRKEAGLFLPAKDTVIVTTKGRNRKAEDETRLADQLYTGPMVVLVDKGSASASEILTGALMDYHRAKSYGETTFGKALVQQVETLGDPYHPCAMPVTIAHYYTPSGYDLQKRGITPDVTVPLDKTVKETNDTDNQAQVALKALKELIVTDK